GSKCEGSGQFPVVNDQGDDEEDEDEDDDQGDEWKADPSGSSWKRPPYEILKVPSPDEEGGGVYFLVRHDKRDAEGQPQKLGRFATLQEAQVAADKDLEVNPYTP